jgi:hypothetical protein
MGWKESPKVFTAATETVADLANQKLAKGYPKLDHRLEAASEQKPPQVEHPVHTPEVAPSGPAPPPQHCRNLGTHYHRPLGLWDVHVDDFLGLVQGNTLQRHHVKLAILRALDYVLCRPQLYLREHPDVDI